MRLFSTSRPLPASLSAAIATVALTAFLFAGVGCSSDRDDTTGLPPATGDTEARVFSDGYLPGVTYRGFLNSKYDAVLIDADEKWSGTSSLAVTVPAPGHPTEWFAGGAFTNEWARDLSGYNAITFYAKAERLSTLNEVGFGLYFNDNPGSEEKRFMASTYNIPLTMRWEKHVIAIPDPSKLSLEAGLFFISEGPEGGGSYTFWLDEIRYEQVAGITNPRPTMMTETVSAFAGSKITPSGTQVTFEVGGKDQLVVHEPGCFTYTSSDESIVRVNMDGTLTAIGNGTAIIKAMLNTTAVVGSLLVNSSTLPTQAAPTPTVPETDVISIFSDAYADSVATVDKWMADWATGNVTDMNIAGNPVKAYTSLGHAVIEFITNTIDADSMTYFHVDVWVPGGTDFMVKLIDFGADGVWSPTVDDTEEILTFNAGTIPPFTPGVWASLEIPMSDFMNGSLAEKAHIAQLVFENVNTVIVDNIYFHK